MSEAIDLSAPDLWTIMRDGALNLACAESCTGGLASAMITSRPGASGFFLGGLVSYAESIKVKVLGISPDTIRMHGAVSMETAKAMAAGAVTVFGADCAFSITGIAGPDGGTPHNPVGKVWFGFSVLGEESTETITFKGDRDAVRMSAAAYAIERMAILVGKAIELDNPLRAGVSFKQGK